MKTASVLKRFPVWWTITSVVMVAAAMIVVGSGITGDVQVKVQEPVTFKSGDGFTRAIQSGIFDETAVVYNDNLSVTVTAFSYPGDLFSVELVLINNSDVDQSQLITIQAPDGFRFSDVTGSGTLPSAVNILGVAQQSPLEFVYTLDDTASGDSTKDRLAIQVELLPQVVPGWYTWTFETEALETDLDNVG